MKPFFTLQEFSCFLLPLLVALTYALFKLIFKKKADIVNTGDDGILITLGTVLVLGGMLMTVAFFLLSLMYMSRLDLSVFGRIVLYIFLALLIVPIFVFVFQYLNIKRYYVSKYVLSEPDKSLEFAIFRRWIQELSDDLRLKYAPTILVSAFNNLQPFVFGRGEKSSYLVIPNNFSQLISDRSLKKEERDLLERFLYLHELSHIRNRDNTFISASSALLRMIWPWLLVLFIVGQLPFLSQEYFGNFFLFFKSILLPILLFSYFLLLVLYFTLSKNREYLADSRALLHLTADETQRLIEILAPIEKGGRSLFEYLLLRLRLTREFIKEENREGAKQTQSQPGAFRRLISDIQKAFDQVLSLIRLHPNDNDRLMYINQKRVFYEDKISPSKTSSVFFGIIVAILVNMGINIGVLFLYVYGTTNTNRGADFISNVIYFGIVSLITLILALIYNLPLSNSINKGIPTKRLKHELIKSHVISLVSFLLTSHVLLVKNTALYDAMYFRNTKFMSFSSWESLLLVVLYAGIMIFSILLAFLIREKILEEEKIEAVLVSSISIGFIFALILILGLHYYSMPIHINVLFAAIASGVLFVSQKRFSGGIINSKLVFSFGKRGLAIKYDRSRFFSMLLKCIFAGFILGVLYFGIPLMLFNHAIFLLYLKYYALRNYLPYIYFVFTVPILFIAFQKKRNPTLEDLGQKAIIARHLGITVSNKFESAAKKALERNRARFGGYKINKSFPFPFMESNYYGALLETFLFGNVKEETLESMLKCQEETGGFRDYFKGTFHLESTYYIVDFLYRENLLHLISSDKTTQWLLFQLDNTINNAKNEQAVLKNLFYCVQSISKIDPNSIRKVPITENDIELLWDGSDKTIENFCYASGIITKISINPHPLVESFRVLWLDVFWKSILKTDIGEQFADVYFFLMSAESLNPYNLANIQQSIRLKILRNPGSI